MINYEKDPVAFPHDAYKTSTYDGVAWGVLGWETEPDADTEWSGMGVRTGKVVAVMVGDDRYFKFDPEDLISLSEGDYCGGCGQIGCGHGGR